MCFRDEWFLISFYFTNYLQYFNFLCDTKLNCSKLINVGGGCTKKIFNGWILIFFISTRCRSYSVVCAKHGVKRATSISIWGFSSSFVRLIFVLFTSLHLFPRFYHLTRHDVQFLIFSQYFCNRFSFKELSL